MPEIANYNRTSKGLLDYFVLTYEGYYLVYLHACANYEYFPLKSVYKSKEFSLVGTKQFSITLKN